MSAAGGVVENDVEMREVGRDAHSLGTGTRSHTLETSTEGTRTPDSVLSRDEGLRNASYSPISSAASISTFTGALDRLLAGEAHQATRLLLSAGFSSQENTIRHLERALEDTKNNAAARIKELTVENTRLTKELGVAQMQAEKDKAEKEAQGTETYTQGTDGRQAHWGNVEAVKRGLLQLDGCGGATVMRPSRYTPTRIKELDQRKARTLVVRVEDLAQRQLIGDHTPSQIVDAIRASSNTAAQEVSTARKLKSGDILLTTTSVEAREELEKKGLGSNFLAASAKILRQTFPVMAHGFAKSALEGIEEKDLLGRLAQMNSQHLPGVEFVKVRLVKPSPKRMGNKEKKFCSLVTDLATPEAANEVVTRGVAFHRMNMTAELFDRGATLRQCFRCQRYGHISRRCLAAHPTCGECAGNHDSRDHSPETHGAKQSCTNCRGAEHSVWSPNCAVRDREIQRMRSRLEHRPATYGEFKRGPVTDPTASMAPKQTTPAPVIPKIDGRTKEGRLLKRQRIDGEAGYGEKTNGDRETSSAPARSEKERSYSVRGRPTTAITLQKQTQGQTTLSFVGSKSSAHSENSTIIEHDQPEGYFSSLITQGADNEW